MENRFNVFSLLLAFNKAKKSKLTPKKGVEKKFGNQGVVAAAGKEKTSSNKKIEVQDWYPKMYLQWVTQDITNANSQILRNESDI